MRALTLVVLVATGLSAAPMPPIRVAPNQRGFVTPSGQPFHPWGVNYDRDYRSRLLEDYWDAEWPAIAGDFAEMKALGANVVRLHLQFGRFMTDAVTPNDHALAQLARLLALAEKTGLYLDLTGLACYRRADVPAWYAALDEGQRWSAQERFWEAVARTCAASPAVFCYDLANEPIVPGVAREAGDWLIGDLGGLVYCQFITLDPAGRATPDVAKAWIGRLAAAIRRHDPQRLVTVGLLPNAAQVGFPPWLVTGDLDFVAVHVYPATDHLAEDRRNLARFAVGKPVVVEETFPLGCSAEQLAQFMRETSGLVSGWIGFYWGQTPAQLRPPKDMGEALTLAWLELFAEGGPWPAPRMARLRTIR
ncbi:MAG: cellulase family glycosylhydrolase [Armatimonadetes bacterium]|nr:cellulase family glycosylhydrolase [Armatimonadota bacterium]